jgi:chitosanase
MPRTATSAKSSTKKPAARTKMVTARTAASTSSGRMGRFGKPLVYVVIFMFVGVLSLAWASAATTTYGLWGNQVPKIVTADDRHNLELGMKFKADSAGYVTGVRFYKSAQNTGTHTGSLWSSSGRQLATVTFTNETASGWQSATFDQPVSVAANTTYVVSYHAPKGRYSVNFDYFTRQSATNKGLTALRATRGTANGVYRYSTNTTYPREDGSGANYWVDVMFNTKLINPPVAPAAPSNLVANIQSDKKTVALSWHASASDNQIANYEIYRDGSKIGSTANTNYTDATTASGKTYAYQVKAVDVTGAASVLSTKVTITLPAADGSGGSGTGSGSGSGGSTGGTGSSGGSTGGTGNSGGGTGTGTGGTGGSTGGTGSSVTLFDASKKEMAMELVSSAENSSLDWKAQYKYLEDIGDGRGYTGGIIGFCSGTGDMLEMIQYYTQLAPGNILAKYIPALQKVNGTDSHTGLGAAFEKDWVTAASDVKFQQAQDHERDTIYFNPAVNQAIADGLHSLGQFIYYDAMVMHGPGSDPVSFGGIRATAMKKAKTPAQGGNETTYLNAYLDARKAAMLTEAAHDDTSRVDTEQRKFLNEGNLNLDVPISWSTYGDPYSITKNP